MLKRVTMFEFLMAQKAGKPTERRQSKHGCYRYYVIV